MMPFSMYSGSSRYHSAGDRGQLRLSQPARSGPTWRNREGRRLTVAGYRATGESTVPSPRLPTVSAGDSTLRARPRYACCCDWSPSGKAPRTVGDGSPLPNAGAPKERAGHHNPCGARRPHRCLLDHRRRGNRRDHPRDAPDSMAATAPVAHRGRCRSTNPPRPHRRCPGLAARGALPQPSVPRSPTGCSPGMGRISRQ